MDPISIGLLLASAAASAAGGGMKANAQSADYVNTLKAETEQARQNTEMARSRNDVLQHYQGLNQGHIASNQTSFGSALAPYAPGAQAAATAGHAATRGSAIAENINAGVPQATQLKETGSPAVAGAYESALAAKMGQSHASGAALGNLGAIGDTWQGNSLAETGARRDIGTTNAIAQDEIGNLPAAQDLAAFQKQRIIRKAPPTDQAMGNLLTGLGGLGGTVAGSGVLNGAGASMGNAVGSYLIPPGALSGGLGR